jgi:hypothetical protein
LSKASSADNSKPTRKYGDPRAGRISARNGSGRYHTEAAPLRRLPTSLARPLPDRNRIIELHGSVDEATFLTALAAEPLHGYGVIQAVDRLSAGDVRLRAGTLYGALDRLTDQGLIEVDHEEADGRLRRYHRLSGQVESRTEIVRN